MSQEEPGEFTQGLEGTDMGTVDSVGDTPDEPEESVFDILMRPTGGYELDDDTIFTDASWRAHLNRAVKGVMESEANVLTDLVAAGAKLIWSIYTGTFWEESEAGKEVMDDMVDR